MILKFAAKAALTVGADLTAIPGMCRSEFIRECRSGFSREFRG
jgi:hypothetical protein